MVHKRKAVAVGPASMSRSHGEAYLDPWHQFSWTILPNPGEAAYGAQDTADTSEAAKGVPSAGQGCWARVWLSPSLQALGLLLSQCKSTQHAQWSNWGTSRHLRGFPWCVHVSLTLESPNLGTALHVWPHQCRAKGKAHLPPVAGKALPSATQGTTQCLWARATCWLLINLVSTRTLEPFLPGCFPAAFPNCCWSPVCMDVSQHASCLHQCHLQSVLPSFCRPPSDIAMRVGKTSFPQPKQWSKQRSSLLLWDREKDDVPR